MFKAELKRLLTEIFGPTGGVTYNAPSESFEQDTIFVDITTAPFRPQAGGGGRMTARVDGTLTVYSQAERTTFGFFARKIEKAPAALTKHLFFYDVDVDIPTSPARAVNIHERRASFRYLYDSQYDPARGQLTSVVFIQE